MKLIEICEKETKQVNYFGIELKIDADVNFLATDDDGFVYGYCKKPMKVPERWIPKGTFQQPIAKVDLGDKDWTETLVEV